MKARFLMLWAAAVIATGSAFVVHLSLRYETVRLGYEVGKARREHRQLIENRRLLAIEAATLRQPERVEAVARGLLGMTVAGPDKVVPMNGARRRRSSGRVR